MKIELRKISISEYNNLLNNINANLDFYMNPEKTDIHIYDDIRTLEEISEPINNSEKIEIEILEEDLKFLSTILKWKENYLVGKLLHKKLQQYEYKFYGVFYERGFWAYICHHPMFRKYIKNRYFTGVVDDSDDEDDKNENVVKKIERFFLCKGTTSRTGVMFNWMLTDSLYDKYKMYELSEVGFSFIDSVKAIYERSFHMNKRIVKAFVQGIINNNKSAAFKDTKTNYRSIIPTHISNIAALNSLDSYDDYKDLVNKITLEQSNIIKMYNRKID
jgi:hypothetical protein